MPNLYFNALPCLWTFSSTMYDEISSHHDHGGQAHCKAALATSVGKKMAGAPNNPAIFQIGIATCQSIELELPTSGIWPRVGNHWANGWAVDTGALVLSNYNDWYWVIIMIFGLQSSLDHGHFDMFLV